MSKNFKRPKLISRLGTGLLFAVIGTAPAAVHAADYATLMKQATTLRDRIDAGVGDSSNDSIPRVRARILEATRAGVQFIKQVTADSELSRDQKADLVQGVAREIGFAYVEALKPQLKASLVQDPGMLDPKDGEHRWSPSYLFRTALPWLGVAVYGVFRDGASLASPVLPGPPKGLPEGYQADDPRLRTTASGTDPSWDLRVPDVIPIFGSSNRLSAWANRMATVIEDAYKEIADRSDAGARQSGFDAIGVMYESTMVDGKVARFGLDDSATLNDGPQNRYQRWVYLAVGLVLVKYGWDFFDAGSHYVTQPGIFMSRVVWASLTYAFMHLRTANSSLKAYQKLQAVVDGLKVNDPSLFGAADLQSAQEVDRGLQDRKCEIAVTPAPKKHAAHGAKGT